jgi:hypothetical protein
MVDLFYSVRLNEEFGDAEARILIDDKIILGIDIDKENAMKMIEAIKSNVKYVYDDGKNVLEINNKSVVFSFPHKTVSFYSEKEYDECIQTLLYDYKCYTELNL